MPGAEELAAESLPPMTRERVAELFDVPVELLRERDAVAELVAEKRREVEGQVGPGWLGGSMSIQVPFVSDEAFRIFAGLPAIPGGFPAAGPRDARNLRR
jgi:hypothetical protein